MTFARHALAGMGTAVRVEARLIREWGDLLARSRPRVMVRVVDALGVSIMSGAYEPGAALPSEGDLSARVGAGRSSVREALKVLTAKGLIRSRPRMGTWVEPERAWSWCDPDVLRWLEVARPEPRAVRELLVVAAALEAAERSTGRPLLACFLPLLATARRLRARSGDPKLAAGTPEPAAC